MPLTNDINCLLFSYWPIDRWQLLIFSSKHAIEPVLDLAMAGCWYSALNLNILIKIVFCLNMRTGNFIFHEFWAIKIAYSLIFSRSKQVFSRKDCLDLGHCTACFSKYESCFSAHYTPSRLITDTTVKSAKQVSFLHNICIQCLKPSHSKAVKIFTIIHFWRSNEFITEVDFT